MPSSDTTSDNPAVKSDGVSQLIPSEENPFQDQVFISKISSQGYVSLSNANIGDAIDEDWLLAKEPVSKDNQYSCRIYYRNESDIFRLSLAQYFQDGSSREVFLTQAHSTARSIWANWYETKIGPVLVLVVETDPHNEYLLVLSPHTTGTSFNVDFHYFSPPHATLLLEHVHIDEESVRITDDCILSYDIQWSPQVRGISKTEHLVVPLVVGAEALKYE